MSSTPSASVAGIGEDPASVALAHDARVIVASQRLSDARPPASGRLL